jgi:hypothetical protein
MYRAKNKGNSYHTCLVEEKSRARGMGRMEEISAFLSLDLPCSTHQGKQISPESDSSWQSFHFDYCARLLLLLPLVLPFPKSRTRVQQAIPCCLGDDCQRWNQPMKESKMCGGMAIVEFSTWSLKLPVVPVLLALFVL